MTKQKQAIAIGLGVALMVLGVTGVIVLLTSGSKNDRDPSSSASTSSQSSKLDGGPHPAHSKADFVDLSAFFTMPSAGFEASAGSTFPQWSCIPYGFQTFLHVPLQIDGIKCLWGSGNAATGANFDEETTGIPVKKKFETLYVYHAAFYESPPKTPVYDLVFRYTDGSSFTNRILYSVDVLDWFGTGGPTGPNSKLAWKGVCTAGGRTQPLRFCLTALENPQPNNEVETIDLYSCKNRSAGCILAMTPGKSGMMK
jgi:hypothetical protein